MTTSLKDLAGGRTIVFQQAKGQSSRDDREGFRRLVELAATYGATHVQVGLLPFRTGCWVMPGDDPYPAWSVTAPSILRVCPPEVLHEWLEPDHARDVQNYLHWQFEIMKPYGLRGSCNAVEPHWLPEGVYRAHPNWRGAQCELGRIARRPYFAPSIDEPEVLDLYRSAMRQLQTLFPEIDEYNFLSNDSGGGIAWTPNVYPGRNGPVKHLHGSGGQRLAGWLRAIQAGAEEAGSSIRLHLHSSGLPTELVETARQSCPAGCFVNGLDREGRSGRQGGATFGGGTWFAFYPAKGLGSPEAFLRGLQGIYAGPEDGSYSVRVHEDYVDELTVMGEVFAANPDGGVMALTRNTLGTARRFCGSEAGADALVEVWRTVDAALRNVAQVRQKGFGLVLPFAGVSMRWLLRPLVPRPTELTADEKAHYERFLFSTASAADNASFGLVLGKGVFRGESVMWMARWCLHEAVGLLRGAAGRVRGLVEQTDDAAARDRLTLYAARIEACACCAANIKNTIMYQYALDVADQPQFGPNPMDYDDNILYDQRALTLRKIAREELDNTYELLALVERFDADVIERAAVAEDESVFMLPVDLAGAMARKAEVMLDHWGDYETLYPATKVWDFEPAPRGNIVDAPSPSDGAAPATELPDSPRP